jgi:hypothetical protein
VDNGGLEPAFLEPSEELSDSHGVKCPTVLREPAQPAATSAGNGWPRPRGARGDLWHTCSSTESAGEFPGNLMGVQPSLSKRLWSNQGLRGPQEQSLQIVDLGKHRVRGRGERQMPKDPFSVLRISSGFLKTANNTKAIVLFGIAIVWQLLLNFSPILLGLYVLLSGGGLWGAIKLVIVLYIAIALYLAFWPVLALIGFATGWIQYGFLVSLISTVMVVGGFFLLFGGPEWLMYKAQQYAAAAAQAEAMERIGEELEEMG